jgi:NTP pyrophosphatase (non-canonical NTP hydrolase)
MGHFQWLTIEQGQKHLEQNHAEISEDLADVLIYVTNFANQAEIDISQAVYAKLSKNTRRFPPSE